MLKAGKGPEALAKLKEAAALPNPTPYEQFLIVRVRAPAEYAAGDTQAATTDFETVLASDQVLAADQLPIMKALSQIVYNNKQYDKCVTWSQRFFDAGGEDAQLHEILAQCQYLMKDYAPAAKAYKTIIDAQYKLAASASTERLRVLASAQSQIHDDAGYMQTIEHLAVDYPTADYWQQLISRAAHVEKLADRQYVDVYRMKAAIYGQVAPEEILSFAGLSARAGYPAEAKHVLDDGFARKAFPAADVGEATKLLPQVTRLAAQDRAQNAANESAAKAAKDGNAAANLGLLDTLDGNLRQGIALLRDQPRHREGRPEVPRRGEAAPGHGAIRRRPVARRAEDVPVGQRPDRRGFPRSPRASGRCSCNRRWRRRPRRRASHAPSAQRR